MRFIAAKFVPRLLSNNWKEDHVSIFSELKEKDWKLPQHHYLVMNLGFTDTALR
jgi:hypothetical protein